MRRVRVIEGSMLPLWRADVDTDQIMPKQFGKWTSRTGYGEVVFHQWRQEPDFVFNDPRFDGANVLVAGPNFGCGSSREHAPWGLQQYGLDALVAPSFADIFRGNCAKIGLLTIELEKKLCERLVRIAQDAPDTLMRIDLLVQRFEAGPVVAAFEYDRHAKRLLVEGLDEIALTLDRSDRIASYEAHRPAWMPSLR